MVSQLKSWGHMNIPTSGVKRDPLLNLDRLLKG
jgi:hypothetical protein